MERIQLPGSTIETSRVGLGCAGLGGRIGERSSLKILDAAASAGVAHYDTARSYGYGESEAILGKFLKANPGAQFTVTTKAGIRVGSRLAKMKLLRSLGRELARRPAARARLNSFVNRSVEEGRFSKEQLRQSLRLSIRALGGVAPTFLLLHECEERDVTDDVQAWLESLVGSGEISGWGIAASTDTIDQILLRAHPYVAQSPMAAESSAERRAQVIIQHSVVRNRLNALMRARGALAEWQSRFEEQLSTEYLVRMLIADALSGSADIVLVGTQRASSASRLGNVDSVSAHDQDQFSGLLADLRI